MNKVLNLLLLLALSGLANAAETAIFDSCDNRGTSVPARPDARLEVLVRASGNRERQEIRYNPTILPRLSANARLFFYAHQCARLGRTDTAGTARRADCVALNTLLDSQQIRYADLPALQAELKFSPEEWSLLPGPPREIDLSNCRTHTGDVLRLPPAGQAPAGQEAWNTCVRACADRLLACRKGSGAAADDNCQAAYDVCRRSCPE